MLDLMTVKQFSKTIYPEYKGRKFYIHKQGTLRLSNTNWDEGSRTYYTAVNLKTGENMPATEFAPWNNPIEGQVAVISPGFGIMTHSYFCGKDCGVTLYHNEEVPDPTKENA